MTTFKNNERQVTIRKADNDGRVLVMFDDLRTYKTYTNQATADRAVARHLAKG